MLPEISIRTDFPHKTREIENTWIPLPDGTQLAARIWLPEDAEQHPVPAILEYLPYRKRDGTVERDQLTYPYFAGFGYAGVRVDMRGTGDSEGVCLGEYLLQEQDDCLAVIDWLTAQPWCSGKVGMIGISWGGFNGLQVAARRPAALAAVISLCSTDDRYADDIHFMGGATLVEKLAWGATAFAIAHTPPDPAIVGKRWRTMWRERLKHNDLWLLDWFSNQRRGDFYTHGSICENYADVEVPVYLVGGWADGYSNTIFRMLEHLSCPKKGLVGPWAHMYPHFALPGPRIGFLQECLRWWDQHLKGIDTGIMEEPQLRAWIQHPAPPAPYYETRPGHWVTMPEWTGNSTTVEARFPELGAPDQAPTEFVLSAPQNAGHTAGNWCGYGLVPDGTLDQNAETGMLVLETEPFEEDFELLGFPVCTTEVTSDEPLANLVAVLSEVLADGSATRISYGILNLTHRAGHVKPKALRRAEPVTVRIQLNACGQRIGKGHRLRLALSTAYWPVIWPCQFRATLRLANIRLDLPRSTGDFAPDRFLIPEGATPLETARLAEGSYKRTRSIDYITGVETCEIYSDSGLQRHLHTGLEVRDTSHDEYSIHPDDHLSATGTCTWKKYYARDDWRAELEARVSVKALRAAWKISATLKATDADGVVADKTWSEMIPRDFT